jgi:hypothetical protein
MAPDRCAALAALAAPALAVLVVLLGLPAPVAAQLYVCKTPTGHTLSGDTPPADCRDSVIRRLNRDGSVREVIEPPLSPEQKEQRALEERKRHERETAAQDQLRKDRALLETYASEDEIEATRDRTLAIRQTLIDRANQSLKEYRADRKHLDDEAEFYLRRPMPDKLKRAIEDNVSLQEQQLHTIGDIRAEMQRINDRYDAELRRYRELVMRGAALMPRKNDP